MKTLYDQGVTVKNGVLCVYCMCMYILVHACFSMCVCACVFTFGVYIIYAAIVRQMRVFLHTTLIEAVSHGNPPVDGSST